MDDDTTEAAWHQLELESWQWLLSHDPAYLEWLQSLETDKETEHEQQH